MKRKTFAACLIGFALIVALTGCPMEGDPPPAIENAGAPIITLQATANNVAYDLDEEITLTFGAVSPDGGSLSWQWYQLPDTYDMGYSQRTVLEDDGEAITGAASAGDPSTESCVVKFSTGGVYNFFVEVTNTNPAKNGVTSASARSATVMVYVIDPADPVAYPVITQHPSGGKRAGAALLSVSATGNGVLTYQWYSNTVNSNIGGTAINGATSETYNTGAASGGVYYVEVTNTVGVNPPKKVTSRPASVEIVGAVTPNVRVRLTANKQQYVRGFGGMDLTWGNFFRIYKDEYEKLYNPYTGLGLNMMRVVIEPGIKDDVAKTSDHTGGIEAWIEDVMTNGNRPDYIESVKLVNKYGGYVLASPWTPPSQWKSSNTINGGYHLETSHYVDYAEWLRDYALYMAGEGAPVYAVSLQNEPNYLAGYDGCDWSPIQMRDFLKVAGVGTALNAVGPGYGGGGPTAKVLIMNGESANTPIFNDDVMNDAVSRALIGVLARHNYGNINTPYAYNTDPAAAPRYGREMWMTEWNANSGNETGYPNDWTWNYVWTFMNDVDLCIRQRDDNAHIWWAMKRFYSFIGEGRYGTVEGAILPRGHGISHYAKFAKEKWRVNLAMSGNLPNGSSATNTNYVNNTNIDRTNYAARVTGFMSNDEKEFSVVMFTPTNTSGGGGQNLGMVAVELPAGYTATGATAMRSNASVKSQTEEVILNDTSKIGYISVPSSNIVSVKFTVIKDQP